MLVGHFLAFTHSYPAHQMFSACFVKYVKTKVLKRLEINKVRGAFNDISRTLLLPLSFGSSSTALLQILDEQICTQVERSGHASFNIHIVYIDHPSVAGTSEQQEAADLLRKRFSSHKFSILPLEDVYKYDSSQHDTLCNTLPRNFDPTTAGNRARLDYLLSSLPSPTSRVDISNILRSKLLLGFAKEKSCDAILYGDSTTRLAEKTLSETAKGRGNSIPWLTADGSSPHNMKIIYPMRDLLRKEIVEYGRVISEPLTPLIILPKSPTPAPVSSKNTTIDDLMSQYFESVEQNFPSIVANVVRTASKLTTPPVASASLSCHVCNFPTTPNCHSWGGDQRQPTSIENETGSQNTQIACYGCARSIEKV